METEKYKLLHEGMQKINVSYEGLKQKHEPDVLDVRQQADTLQRELDKATKSPANTMLEGWHVINSLRAELDAIRQNMTEDSSKQQGNTLQREKSVKELKAQLNKQISLKLQLSKELEAEREDSRSP